MCKKTPRKFHLSAPARSSLFALHTLVVLIIHSRLHNFWRWTIVHRSFWVLHPTKITTHAFYAIAHKNQCVVCSTSAQVWVCIFPKSGPRPGREKNGKMANYSSLPWSFFSLSEMPSISVCRAYKHRIWSGKVVIYRISRVITGCQKRRLDESSRGQRGTSYFTCTLWNGS